MKVALILFGSLIVAVVVIKLLPDPWRAREKKPDDPKPS
jgi:hypothetical protein